MKSIDYTQYKNAVDAIGHLILTKPEAVTALLAEHGVEFSPPPKKAQLVNEIIEMLAEDNNEFNEDLSELLDVHLEYKAQEINELIDGDDEFLGGLVGGLAKGLVGAVGGLFGKKKKRGGGNSNNNAAAQAAQLKADMQRQIQRMRQEQKRREEEARKRRQEEERRRRKREEEDRRRRERQREQEMRLRTMAAHNKTKKAGMNPLLIVGLAVVVLGGLFFGMRGKSTAPSK